MSSSSPLEGILAGGLAGLFANTIMHPADSLKAHVQFSTGSKQTVSEMIAHTVKKEGYLTYYRGFSSVVATTFPATGLYFVAYEKALKNLPGGSSSLSAQFGAGVFAQTCASFAFTPRDVIKERLQVQHLHSPDSKLTLYSNSWDALKSILKHEGVKGLYRGYFQTLTLWSIYGGMYLSAFTYLKRLARSQLMVRSSYKEEGKLPLPAVLACAVIAASASAAVTNPLDVLKLHYQVRPKHQSGMDLFQHIHKQHGLSAWTRGTLTRVGWIAPRTALSFTAYEWLRPAVSNLLGH